MGACSFRSFRAVGLSPYGFTSYLCRGMMRVTIARRHFYFHPTEVEQAMSGVTPEPVAGPSVEIGGTAYPLMQVGAVITRQDRRDFSADEVYRAMQALGFTCRTRPS
jgi:hypothetical protein